MKLMSMLAVGLLVVGSSVLSAEDKKPAAFDATKLAGKWTITAGTKNGEKIDASKYKDAVTITKDMITLKSPDGAFEFKYTVDAKASPVAIDLEITAPDMFKGTKGKGIIVLEGDTAKLCYHAMGGDRPKAFESKKDSGVFLFEMKKSK